MALRARKVSVAFEKQPPDPAQSRSVTFAVTHHAPRTTRSWLKQIVIFKLYY